MQEKNNNNNNVQTDSISKGPDRSPGGIVYINPCIYIVIYRDLAAMLQQSPVAGASNAASVFMSEI